MSYADQIYEQQRRSFAFAERWRSPVLPVNEEYLVEEPEEPDEAEQESYLDEQLKAFGIRGGLKAIDKTAAGWAELREWILS